MKRDAMDSLVAWKTSPTRKPLVVTGARQVGKTWLVSQFGREQFGDLAHVTFLDNEEMRHAFEQSLDPDRLLGAIGIATGTNPLDGDTLVFLDEIQECPRAMTSLKLFCEQRPEVPIVAAGSLLGVALNRRGRATPHAGASLSWPVGKVDYLDMHPMTFAEFVGAAANEQLSDVIRGGDLSMMETFSERLTELLKTYLFVGGMPEAVQAFVDASNDYARARSVQERLLRDYEYDFAKHIERPADIERTRQVWHSVPAQLASPTDSRRFTYSKVEPGGRGRDYKDAVSWLADAGLVTRVPRISRPLLPLASYEDEARFKLYLVDVGLLGAATSLDVRTILDGNELFTHFKGAYAEQFVCQELVASNRCKPRYWSGDGKRDKGEIDFLYECEGRIYPVEVKADDNVRSRSLASFAQANGIERCIRLSLLGYQDQGWMVNIPLYAAGMLPKAF